VFRNEIFAKALMFSTIFGFLLWRKLKIKFMHASMKSQTNSKNPYNNPLQEACSGFQIVVPKAARNSENCSESGHDM
jgi:hypothetical protein